MNNVLAIDFSIFGNAYHKMIKFQDYEYTLRDSRIDFGFDFELYKKIFDTKFLQQLSDADVNVHFVYRQTDILDILPPDSVLYNIDYYNDIQDWTYTVNWNNWIKYLLDKKKISDYNWICCSSSTNKQFSYMNVEDIDLTTYNFSDIYICLSPEFLNSKYHEMFYTLHDTVEIVCKKELPIHENYSNIYVYKDVEYDDKYCYATLLTSNSYAHGVLGLNYSLRYNNSKHRLITICTDNVSKSTVDMLRSYGITCFVFDDLLYSELNVLPDNSSRNMLSVINKSYVFRISGYEKVMFLDADVLAMKNLDFMFETECNDTNFCGLLSSYESKSVYAAGLFIFKPDENYFEKVKTAMLEEYEKLNPADSSGLTKVFCPITDIKLESSIIWHHDCTRKYWLTCETVTQLFTFVKTQIDLDKQISYLKTGGYGKITRER